MHRAKLTRQMVAPDKSTERNQRVRKEIASGERFEFQIAELDVEELRLQADVSLWQRTGLPGQRGRAIDPDGDRLAPRRHLVSVPFTGRVGALGSFATNQDAEGLAFDQAVAKQVAHEGRLLQVSDLHLMPELAVAGGADVDAAVVILLPLDLAEPPLDMKDAVSEFLVVEQHLLDADAVAQQQIALDFPRVLDVELRVRRQEDTFPSFEVLAGQQVNPALGITFQGALLCRLGLCPTSEEEHRDEGNQWSTHGVNPWCITR